MKAIIAAVDFSPVSINAAEYAADLSAAISAELLLINVVQLPVSVGEVPVTGYAFEKMVKDAETELGQLKEKLLRRVDKKIRIYAKTEVGSILETLKHEAREAEAFAIVMGTDSTTGIEHLFKDNYAVAAIHGISTPVLIIPERASFKGIRKIVLAADLRAEEELVPLHLLKEWIKIFPSYLDIVCIVKESEPSSADLAGTIGLQDELGRFKPQFHFIHENKIRDGVREYIEQNHPDLLVTMPGHYGFVERLFHRSQSKQLIHDPKIPVLSILD